MVRAFSTNLRISELDAAWHALIEELNRAGAPIQLQAMRVLARDGYGWTEYVKHAGCTEDQDVQRFFRRAGAWLALFHCFAATDMHHENMIAAGDQPIPIDLETILQAAEDQVDEEPEGQAFQAAKNVIANSVMAVGLLPAYGRSADNDIFQVGGVASDWSSKIRLSWNNINSDTMRPKTTRETEAPTSNLPHINGEYAKLADHVEDLISGFEKYARFLGGYGKDGKLFDRFAGLPSRKVVRPTQFYYMLLQRLKDDRTMHDGAVWSAQADFLARLANWEKECDPQWELQRVERKALLELNVPYFASSSDMNEISDTAGVCVRAQGESGLDRARARVRELDEQEIAWQVEVIRQNASFVSTTTTEVSIGAASKADEPLAAPSNEIFLAEADRVAEEISRNAIRRGPGAAWIGQNWLSGSDVSQLAVLEHDLYSGTAGIAVFLAAHAQVRRSATSSNLALASLSYLRRSLKDRNAASAARLWGVGGATGLGSVVYSLAVTAKLLHNDELLADAHRAAELFTDDLIAADKQLDVIGGSAGAILGLLRLHRDSPSDRTLKLAEKCGEHLLARPRVGREGARSWIVPGPHSHPLNGMSHGAAGFALALSSLAAETGRRDFAKAASDCIAFENASYNPKQKNWPDFREAEPHWRSQWCHGAVGIGLARVAMKKIRNAAGDTTETDVRNALAGASANSWRGHYDTLCCGSLGNVEFICEAGKVLARDDLRGLASRRLASVLESTGTLGDYRWSGGSSRHNLGLFRGLAGVGYTCLRQVTDVLPNVLVWE